MGTDGPQVPPIPGRLPFPLIPLFLHGITPFRTVAHTIPPIVRGEAYHRNIWYTLGLSTRFSTGLHHLSDTRTFVRLPCRKAYHGEPAPAGVGRSTSSAAAGKALRIAAALFSEGQHRTDSAAPHRQGSTRGAGPPTPPDKTGRRRGTAGRAGRKSKGGEGGRPPGHGGTTRPVEGRTGRDRQGGEARRPPLPLSPSCPGPAAPRKSAPARGGRGAPEGRTRAPRRR